MFFLAIVKGEPGISYNQPKFCPNAKWSSAATTFANDTVFGDHPHSIFINREDNIYVADTGNHKLRIWLKGDKSDFTDISVRNEPRSHFASQTGDIYTENSDKKVIKQKLNDTSPILIGKANERCNGLFVDINDALYCSMKDRHAVEKLLLNSPNNGFIAVAGKPPQSNSGSDGLNKPHGIFVDLKSNLYVADCGNNRIQYFQFGQTSGNTVAGLKPIDGKNLSCPTGVVLDGNNHLFIVDQNNHRIIRFNSINFQCVVGCSDQPGQGANQLNHPYALAFDSKGDMFVVDSDNKRLQKYDLISNSCIINYNQPKFCSFPSWKPEAETIAGQSEVGENPYGIFVSINDSVYVPVLETNKIRIWSKGSNVSIETTAGNGLKPTSLFVTSNGVIYVDNGKNGRIIVITSNETTSFPLINVTDHCYDLFIDILNTLYCSVAYHNLLVRKALENYSSSSEIIANDGFNSSLSVKLDAPRAIFVDDKINIYVAEARLGRIIRSNHTLQDFEVVAGGEKAEETIDLSWPSGIALDGDGYLYIVDEGNNRIVGSGPYGFRCLVGCTGRNGSTSDQLSRPWTMHFDRQGNMFVTDVNNNRIQKFLLAKDSCVLSYNQPKLSPCASWNMNGTTFVNTTIPSNYYNKIFVDNNNNVYIIDNLANNIQIWSRNETIMTVANISIQSDYYSSIFLTIFGEIYIANINKSQVQKFLPNGTEEQDINLPNMSCYRLFIDVNNNLYCSIGIQHKVVKISLLSTSKNSTIVAGNGSAGAESHLLDNPHGIFVDVHLNLFVADFHNARIQRFKLNQPNGTTVPSKNDINLFRPTDIVLDADGNLFIVDYGNHRIVTSNSNGFRCIIGCYENGSTPNQLLSPLTMNFDSFGNIYVFDIETQSVQIFYLTTNICTNNYSNETTTPSQMLTVTTPNNIAYTVESSTNQDSSETLKSSTHEYSSSLSSTDSISTTASETSVITTMTPSLEPIMTSTEKTTSKIDILSPSVFKPKQCKNSSVIGINCSTPNNPCDNLKPCLNNGTCTNIHNAYKCTCHKGFNGSECQHDQRICKQNACFNHGRCNKTFHCVCDPGWQGLHCQTKIDFCTHHLCQNNAVCRSSVRNYTCECLGNYYYGQYCEKMTRKVIIFKFISKSFAYVAILGMAIVAMFVLVMDILKYCFGIDPVKEERERMRNERVVKKRKPMTSHMAINNSVKRKS